MNYEFKWSMLLAAPYAGWIAEAFAATVLLALGSWVLALVIGVPTGVIRTTRSRTLRALGALYVEVFRNVPPIVQLFLWFFVVPLALPAELQEWWNRLDSAPYWTALIGISCFTAARVAEHVRAAIGAVPRGQFNAALSTGLSPVQAYRYVIAPYALRIVIPSLTSEFLTVFKNTALALTIGVFEITSAARKIEAWSFKGIEAYTVASATYIVTTIAVIALMHWVERRTRIAGLIGQAPERG